MSSFFSRIQESSQQVLPRCLRISSISLFTLALSMTFTTNVNATTPISRLDAYQDFFTQTKITDEASARAFLVAHADRYQLETPETLTLQRIQPSLSSRHYHFQQMFKGVVVDRAEIIISVDINNDQVIRVHNSTKNLLQEVNTTATKISAADVLEKIWQLQSSSSQLLIKPRTRLVYIETGGSPQLVYRINLATNQQAGDWEYTVDAYSGEVLTIERLDTPAHLPKDFQRNINPAQLKTQTKSTYATALATLNTKNNLRKKTTEEVTRANGTALLFDPDPITALQNLELTINSPLEAFDAAYVERPLRDIALTNGVYSLNGPWVTIEDKEDPFTAPSTTIDGNWRAKRNETAFLDAMAYFHLDQSQRYIQSLGFKDESGIQFAPISVDAQGAMGVHNAFYMQTTNTISFGAAKDCPAMAEDADVILHEYGHAIHFSINPNWYGGDTGAMGEGFSDYWAASYGLTTLNGATFYPERNGNWIAFNPCWVDGRLLNRTDKNYIAGKAYAAHEKVGDHWSDELWAAPLYSSLRTLLAKGVAREEVDRIILEAHFGLGSEMTMPEMAKAIIITAKQMYPQGEHAAVFRNSFIKQKILPESVSFEDPQLFGSRNEGVIAGSTLGVSLNLRNNSEAKLSNLTPTVSSNTPGVKITTTEIPSIDVDADSQIPLKFNVEIADDIACGSQVKFTAGLNYEDPETKTIKNIGRDYAYLVGEHKVRLTQTKPMLKIPATVNTEIISELQVEGLPINTNYFELHLDLRISLFAMPSLSLISPAGTRIYITGFPFWDTEVVGTVPGKYGYKTIFVPLAGENPNGTWKLQLTQPESFAAAGLLMSWGISTLSEADCTNTNPVTLDIDSLQLSQASIPYVPTSATTPSFRKNSNVQVDYVLRNNSQENISAIEVALDTPVDIENLRQSTPITTLDAFSLHKGQFSFLIPDATACGSTLPVNINYSHATAAGIVSKKVSTNLLVGSAFTTQFSTFNEALEIPDNDSNGITQTVSVVGRALFNDNNVRVHLSFEHPNPADLDIKLRSPKGTEIILVKPDNNLPTYVNHKFPSDLEPVDSFSILNNENPNGTWTLTVKDTKPGNVGEFQLFGFEVENELDCAPNNINMLPTAILNKTTFEVNEGQSVTIDASGSSDPEGDTLSFSYIQIEGPTHPLQDDQSSRPRFVAPQVETKTLFTYKLIVADIYGLTNEQTFTINVNNVAAVSSSSRSSKASNNSGGSGGGGGSINFGLIALMIGIYLYRRPRG